MEEDSWLVMGENTYVVEAEISEETAYSIWRVAKRLIRGFGRIGNGDRLPQASLPEGQAGNRNPLRLKMLR
jgi:hypothetical protein